jgi:competence protein ComEC
MTPTGIRDEATAQAIDPLETGAEKPVEDSFTTPPDDPPALLLKKTTEGKAVHPSLEPKRLLKAYEDFLVPALVLFMLGNALAWALPGLAFAQLSVGLPLILILSGLLTVTVGKQGQAWAIRLALWLIILVAGSLYYQTFRFQPAPNDISHHSPVDRASVVGRILHQASGKQVAVRVTQVNGKPAGGQLLATLPDTVETDDDEPLQAGTRVLMVGDLVQPYDNPVPGAFNQARYLRSQQITALLKRPERVIAFETSQQPWFELQRMAEHLKNRVAEAFRQALPSPHAEVLGGIVLGDRAVPVDRDTRQAFIQTGLIHLLAASGMNVGIIAAAVLGLLSLFKLPYRSRLGIAMAAVALYSLLTGLPPSIQRAAAMLELALMLKMLNRELSPVFLLCVASTLLVLIHPDNIASIGFQFSVLTTFGLVTMVPRLQDRIGFYVTRWLAGLVLVPAVAQLWIWPLSVYYFNQFPLHTVPLNILAFLLVTPLTVLGFSAGLLSMINFTLGGLLAKVAYPFLSLLLALVDWGNGMGWAKWSLASPDGWMVAALYIELFVLLGLTYGPKSWPFRRRALIALIPIALILGGLCAQQTEARKQATIDILPLSYRHEAFLVKPAGDTQASIVLLPTGLNYWEGRTFADFLRHHQITRLQAVLLLPEEQDGEASGFKAAFKAVQVAHFLLPSGTEPPTGLQRPVQYFPARGARLQAGDFFLEGDLDALRLASRQFCLLSVDTRYQAGSDCAIQAVREAGSHRLFPAKTTSLDLQNNRYYRLIQRNGQLAVY